EHVGHEEDAWHDDGDERAPMREERVRGELCGRPCNDPAGDEPCHALLRDTARAAHIDEPARRCRAEVAETGAQVRRGRDLPCHEEEDDPSPDEGPERMGFPASEAKPRPNEAPRRAEDDHPCQPVQVAAAIVGRIERPGEEDEQERDEQEREPALARGEIAQPEAALGRRNRALTERIRGRGHRILEPTSWPLRGGRTVSAASMLALGPTVTKGRSNSASAWAMARAGRRAAEASRAIASAASVSVTPSATVRRATGVAGSPSAKAGESSQITRQPTPRWRSAVNGRTHAGSGDGVIAITAMPRRTRSVVRRRISPKGVTPSPSAAARSSITLRYWRGPRSAGRIVSR